MDTRFYNSKDINIEQVAIDLARAYQAMGYQAQHVGNNEQVMVQFKKGSDFEALVGMQATLSVTLQRNVNGVMVAIGQQRWIDKAAVGVASLVIPVLWPLTFTAGFGFIRQATLGHKVLNTIDGLVHQQMSSRQGETATKL